MFSKRSWRAFVCACVAGGVGGLSSCLDRPVTPSEPHTSNVFVDLTAQHGVDKIDLLFMIDNSRSMADKQEILRLAVPQLLWRLLNPLCRDSAGNTAQVEAGACPSGFQREYEPVDDIHIGVISSSLGAPASRACASEYAAHGDDAGQLVGLNRTRADGTPLRTYQGLGFLAWDPKGKKAAAGLPSGESDPEALIRDFQELVVATGESGCGYEASLEAWYRFLVDPAPPARWVVENDVARPEGVDLRLLEQRRQFLRPDSLLAIVMLSDENDCSLDFTGDGWIFAYNGENTPGQSFQMPRATSACASDPLSPCCRPCIAEPHGPPAGCGSIETDPVCSESLRHSSTTDPRNLRCFNQKRRFGVERLHPARRYVDALRSSTVVAHDGSEHPNPLFTDPSTGETARRTPDLVFLAGIVGVPWQDVATSDSLMSGGEGLLRYRDAAGLRENGVWPLILGDSARGILPADPLMRESVEPRQGTTPGLYPLEPPEAGPLANPINGHEYYPSAGADLQYACIFPLQSPVVCEDTSCDCNMSEETLSPLCQQRDGQYGETQLYAKAYPGLRQLEVLEGIGDSGIVASICPKLLPDESAMSTVDPNVGYNPAVEAILEVIGSKLGGECVPRQLTPDQETGHVPCAMVEVMPRAEGQCTPCSRAPGRREVDPKLRHAVLEQLVSVGRCQGTVCPETCLCEIEQAVGEDLTACQSDPNASAPGYCYIDQALQIGDPGLIEGCPNLRGLRFVGEDTPRTGSQTFIACIGAAFADTVTGL